MRKGSEGFFSPQLIASFQHHLLNYVTISVTLIVLQMSISTWVNDRILSCAIEGTMIQTGPIIGK
jgi:divalent metal cation (Fe/Co/Zn/Cd) transporter